MAYDEALAARIRDRIGAAPDLSEKKMFGGLAFLIGGNMAVAASGQGGILVRVDPEESDALVAGTPADPRVRVAGLADAKCREMPANLAKLKQQLETPPANSII